jgi:cytochrome oxidase assembly protein ShyY1
VYRFLLKPRWIASHVFVLVVLVTFMNLGFWQLNRLDERRDENATITARFDEAPVPATDVPLDETDEDLEFRIVEATGTYDRSGEVLIRNRSRGGAPGYWVLTPLILEDGTALAVNRGWIPLGFDPDQPRPDVDPPTGTVSAVGFLRASVEPGRLAQADPAEGVLSSLARPDLARLDQQVDADVRMLYLQLETRSPAQAGELPFVLERPELNDGPHLSYAGQWFIFTLIGLVGYPLAVRRIARSRARAESGEQDISDPLDWELAELNRAMAPGPKRRVAREPERPESR